MSLSDAVLLCLILKRRKNKKCKLWVHPFYRENLLHSSFSMCKHIEDPKIFHSYYRMSAETFQTLVGIVGPTIRKKDTNYRQAISVEERIVITLRYLATGMSFRALSFHFMRGENTIGRIVEEVASAIWNCLNIEFMPVPSERDWLAIADRYLELWNLPNCIGSIDGKHIRISHPPHTGSEYFNYKSYYSIQLLACADADGKFITVDVGDYGRNSDGAVFKHSSLGKLFTAGLLKIPSPQPLPAEQGAPSFPFFFVGDAAFPLSKNLMKPFPQRELTNEKRIYNYRLSRARRSVECAFGMLSSKFRVFYTPISCRPDKIDKIVKAACVLHNFIKSRDGNNSQPTWQEEVESYFLDNSNLNPCNHRPTAGATSLRDRLCNYVNKPEVALPWQYQYCV